MAYTAPKTWSVAEVLTAANLNTYLRDNQTALKDPPSGNYEANEGSNYTTTNTAFENVDGTNLSLTITTTGGDVMVHFHGTVTLNATSSYVNFEITDNGTAVGGDDGVMNFTNPSSDYLIKTPVSFTRLITSVTAGSHTYNLQWKVKTGNTATLYAGAGTGTNLDVHPQLWAREVS